MESSAPKYINRSRPTFFRQTQSSKNRASRNSDVNTAVGDKSQDLSSKKMNVQDRLLGSKLAIYASTPNLISGLDDDDGDDGDDDDEAEAKPQTAEKASASNLRLLSDLSQSVPDVKDADSCIDSSGTSRSNKQSRRSVPGAQKRVTTRCSVTVNNKQIMGPPQTIPSSSSRISSAQATNSVVTFSHSKQDAREFQTLPSRRKSSSSELTLNQAKNILLGKSGVLTGSSKPVETASVSASGATGRSVRYTRISSASSGQSSLSTLTSGNPTPAFDHKQLAVAEEIEHTANMLRHQKQANIGNTFPPEHLHANSLNLEASPLDLPERDQPNRHSFSPKQSSHLSTSLSSQQQNVGTAASQSFQPNVSSRVSPDSADLVTAVEDSQGPDSVFDDHADVDRNVRSVRDRIAQYQSQSQVRGASVRNPSPYRRILPASPNMAATLHENNQSDTGLSSVSSDTDSSGHSLTHTDGTKPV